MSNYNQNNHRLEIVQDFDNAYKSGKVITFGLLDTIINGFGKFMFFMITLCGCWSTIWVLFASDNALITHSPNALYALPVLFFLVYGYLLHRKDVNRRRKEAIAFTNAKDI